MTTRLLDPARGNIEREVDVDRAKRLEDIPHRPERHVLTK